jgi:hypothetical protein
MKTSFVFQGRKYDMKVSEDKKAAVVVYQKVPKCVMAFDDDGWFLVGGSQVICDEATRHLKSLKG